LLPRAEVLTEEVAPSRASCSEVSMVARLLR